MICTNTECKKEYNSKAKYCSAICRATTYYRKKNNIKLISKYCNNCNKEFKTYHKSQKYCSYECHKVMAKIIKQEYDKQLNLKKYPKIKLICPICNRIFYAPKNEKYCSDKCYNEAMRKVKQAYKKRHPEQVKKEKAKRKRNLGFNILWKPNIVTETMNYHHIDRENVVMIPERLHQLIWHDLDKNINMTEINELTLFYYLSNLNCFSM
jgi:hypothetical protein